MFGLRRTQNTQIHSVGRYSVANADVIKFIDHCAFQGLRGVYENWPQECASC